MSLVAGRKKVGCGAPITWSLSSKKKKCEIRSSAVDSGGEEKGLRRREKVWSRCHGGGRAG